MLFTTTTQYVALAVALIAGWLFGLASHPGGRRWKQRYADEREAHATVRRDHEARLAEVRQEQDAQVAQANARAADLERENARLTTAAPVTATPTAPIASTATTYPQTQVIAPSGSTRPAEGARGWFDWRSRPGTTAR